MGRGLTFSLKQAVVGPPGRQIDSASLVLVGGIISVTETSVKGTELECYSSDKPPGVAAISDVVGPPLRLSLFPPAPR